MSNHGNWRFRSGLCRKAAKKVAAMAGPHKAQGVAVVIVFDGGATVASIATCNGLRDTRRKVKKASEYALARFDLEDGPDALADFTQAQATKTAPPHREGEATHQIPYERN